MKRNANNDRGHDGSKGNGTPRWRKRLDDYRADELAVLTFPAEKDLHAAVDLVWVGALQGMPFNVVPDGESLAVPKRGVRYFRNAGIRFAERPFKS